MWFGVVTIFPQMFAGCREHGVVAKAIQNGIVSLTTVNPRDFATDSYKTVDDRPYGGGPGMVLKAEPLQQAINACKQQAPQNTKVIALSPQGKQINQQMLQEYVAAHAGLIMLAGRYEGIDERVYDLEVDEEWSLGDFVLSGGELPAQLVMDAMARLVPGVLGHQQSAQEDSFCDYLLDCPHYTRPEEFGGLQVPQVLLSGNHAAITAWRHEQRVVRTKQRRPDLWLRYQTEIGEDHE